MFTSSYVRRHPTPALQIAVVTPGRFIDLIKMKACNAKRVTYLVFDEADRMFDLGFEPQVRREQWQCGLWQCGLWQCGSILINDTLQYRVGHRPSQVSWLNRNETHAQHDPCNIGYSTRAPCSQRAQRLLTPPRCSNPPMHTNITTPHAL